MRFGATLLATALVAAVLVVASAPAAAETGTRYRPPVDGPVLDPFRPPPNPYGTGNRGLDLAGEPGAPVTAAAGGEVVFAGQVGRSRHVVVLHPDGIRTTYAFLADVAVRRGDRVEQGDTVGHVAATGAVHFGARAGDRYIDPALLLDGGAVDVHLVPIERGGIAPVTEAEERRSLLATLAGAAGWATDEVTALVTWAAEVGWEVAWSELERWWIKANVLAHYHQTFFSVVPVLAVIGHWRRMQPFRDSQDGCTPAGVAPPSPRSGRRIVVLVAGFGSGPNGGAVRNVDTAALGYGTADVVLFDYGPEGSTTDIVASGRRLRDQLQAIRAAHPGVPVDVIAHSQGGLVARSALGDAGDAFDPRLPRIENLVTLGTPHRGADVATAVAGVGTTGVGEAIGLLVQGAGGPDATSDAAAQMAETSSFIRDLAGRPLPAGTRVTSIAARGDLVVPALNTSLEGATNVLVGLVGPSAHGDLPGSAETTREIALALAGRGPTCRNLDVDLAGAAALSTLIDGHGAFFTAAGTWLDLRMPGPTIPIMTPGPR